MAVKIGNHYVTESAQAYAQSRVDEKSDGVLNDLSKQFPNVNFSVGGKMFSGSGTNNFSIAPNILRQMANDPDKRLEYEALIYDCANVLKDSANRPGLKAQGIVLDSKGELSMWSISQTGDDKPNRSLFKLTDDEKQRLAGRRPNTKASTDKVDAEIKQLKTKKAHLEQKISSDPNSADLQRQLAQIENELRQKDNDAYRRRLAKFSAGIDITA